MLGVSMFQPDLCFTRVDFLEVKTVHSDLCDAILFNNVTPLILLLSFFFFKLNSKNDFLSHIFYQSFFILWQYIFNSLFYEL